MTIEPQGYVLRVSSEELLLLRQGLLALNWDSEEGWPAAEALSDVISAAAPDMEVAEWSGEAKRN